MSMKKWLVPLTFLVISIVVFLLIGVFGILGNGDGTGYGGVAIVFGCIIIYCVLAIPTMCFLYSRHCLLEQRFSFLFTLYPSVLITIPYFIFFSKAYGVILFVWCELWALLGLVKFKRKNTKQGVN